MVKLITFTTLTLAGPCVAAASASTTPAIRGMEDHLIGECFDSPTKTWCGERSQNHRNSSCYCDTGCTTFGDCCSDYVQVCLTAATTTANPPGVSTSSPPSSGGGPSCVPVTDESLLSKLSCNMEYYADACQNFDQTTCGIQVVANQVTGPGVCCDWVGGTDTQTTTTATPGTPTLVETTTTTQAPFTTTVSDHSPEDLFQILIAQCEVNYELCRLQSYNPEVLGLVDGVGGPPPSYEDAKNRLDSDKEKLQEALNEEQDRLIKCRQKFDTCEAAVNNVTTPVPTTTTAPPTTTTTTILGTTTTMRVTTARPTTTTSVAEETTTTTTRDPLLICQDQCIANFT